MRLALVIALAFLMGDRSVRADAPIPQDAALRAKRHQELLDWNRRTLEGAYDKVGKRDARWDKPAREAMELAALYFSDPVDPTGFLGQGYRSAQAAIDAGCDDPLVAYLFSRASEATNFPGKEEYIRRRRIAAKALAASQYPAVRRAVAIRRDAYGALVDEPKSPEVKLSSQRDFDGVLALLAESVKLDERNKPWEDTWYDTLRYTQAGFRLAGLEDLDSYQRVDAALAKIPEVKVLQLQLRGNFYTLYGWKARTNAFAPDVPADAAETFQRRLVEARKAFTEAWELRPGDGRTALGLLEIEKSIGGVRAEMERWFKSAMEAEPDSRAACLTKLDWLDPKWHGTPEEMLAFGKRCLDTKNWRAGITLLFCDAHRRYKSMLEPGERAKYIDAPETWPPIEAAYKEYLEHYPDDNVARSQYASMCVVYYHYLEADEQFNILGDRLVQWSEFPFYPLATLKQMRQDVRTAMDQRKKAAGATAKPKP
jgi:hypothetical protein